jgi:acetyl esterase/lipase
VGDAEGLLDDSVSAANKAHAAGVAVTLEVWPDMIHVWHAFAPRFPQAMAALRRISSWLDER